MHATGAIDVRELKAAFRALGFNVSRAGGYGSWVDAKEAPGGGAGAGADASMQRHVQVKKAELKSLLQNIDKEMAQTITFDEFLGMTTPKVID